MPFVPSIRGFPMAIGLFCVFLLLIQASLSTVQWAAEPADIHAYRIAAEKVAAGADPYVAKDGNRTLQCLYPPTFVLLFSPALTLAGARGLALWAAMEMALMASVVFFIFRIQNQTGRIGIGFCWPRPCCFSAPRGGTLWRASSMAS